jgi:hypothetical protein
VKRLLLALGALLWLSAPGVAGAERIRHFRGEGWLHPSGEFRVEERIVYDFEGARKHGIFRDVPIRYGRGAAADYRIALDIESVTDANGANRPFRVSSDGAQERGVVSIAADRPFVAGEGLTVVVSLPKGALSEPSALAKALDRASDWLSWAFALPLLVFFGMGALWRKIGRDPSGPVSIPVRYEPPEDMTPAERGTVLDESVDMSDITATTTAPSAPATSSPAWAAPSTPPAA